MDEFWVNKKVLLTGHTGFKGGWMSLWLQQLGAKVVGFSLEPPTNPSLFEVANVADGMESVVGDIRHYNQLEKVISEFQPEIVIHMAAQALVRNSYDEPLQTYATNVMGTVNLLEVIRKLGGVKVFLNITSDKCYENKEWVWGYREGEPLGGRDPYSNSKACSELVTSAYRDSFFAGGVRGENRVAVATARAGNVIGGGDWAKDRLVPDIMKAIVEGRPVEIRNPASIRPWQHVLDPLAGYMTLIRKLWTDGEGFAGAWNFGPKEDNARPVSWIVERMIKLWGQGASWKMDRGKHAHEARYLKLDCSKSKADLGYSPQLTLAASLDWVVEWLQAYQNGSNMRQFTLGQISSYESLSNQSQESV